MTGFERLVNRRGQLFLFSDNARTFVGAYICRLKSAYQNWSAPNNVKSLSDKGTKWTFMSPASPHQGGIYETAVKSAKYHIRRVIGGKHFSYEHFLTFLTKVEAVLNSRPIYVPTDEISNDLVITPGHFLIGEAPVLPPPISSPKVTNYSLQRVREEQRKNFIHFWKSWRSDYLSSLLPRFQQQIQQLSECFHTSTTFGYRRKENSKWKTPEPVWWLNSIGKVPVRIFMTNEKYNMKAADLFVDKADEPMPSTSSSMETDWAMIRFKSWIY